MGLRSTVIPSSVWCCTFSYLWYGMVGLLPMPSNALYSASVARFRRLVSATTQFCIRSVALSLCIMYYVCAFVLAQFDHTGT